MKLRGVSELVSASLLALIVVIVGGAVAAAIMQHAAATRQLAEQEYINNVLKARQELEIAITYIDGNDLVAIIVTDNMPVRLNDVYINGTLVTGNCRISLNNGETVTSIKGYTLPYYTAATLRCTMPHAAQYAKLLIVYEGGEAYAEAKTP